MEIRITVITPTFNRANVLNRVFESLNHQTVRNFEWIIVDDGSKDQTEEVVKKFISQADYPVYYYYQENNGKHIAVNKGVSVAKGEFIAIADSDDEFTADAFEIMLKHWDSMSDKEKQEFRGITCRCFDPDTGEKIGRTIQNGYEDYYGLDATYKMKLDFEMWGINRTDLMKKFPFPDIRRTEAGGLRFFPETVIWDRLGRNYKVRYIDDCLRAYYRDQENATTSRKTRRSRENVYLWEHLINEVLDYAKYKPKRFLKAFVGISMDGLLIGENFRTIVNKGQGFGRKAFIIFFFPAGWLLYRKYREE